MEPSVIASVAATEPAALFSAMVPDEVKRMPATRWAAVSVPSSKVKRSTFLIVSEPSGPDRLKVARPES